MDKEELLRRSRLENKKGDEREIDILQKSTKAGMIAGLAYCMVLMMIKIFLGQPHQDIYSLYSVILSAYYGYRWTRQRECKTFLIGACVWGAVGIFLFVVYLVQIL